MSDFTILEKAVQSRPLELFAFAQGNEAWYYTSFNKDVVRIGDTYRAALIRRSGSASQSEEGEQSAIKVQLGYDLDLAVRIRNEGLRSNRGMMVMRFILTHDGDTNIYTPFIGECTLFSITSTHVEVTVESVRASFKRKLLHVSGSLNCNHPLYSPGCGANKETHKSLSTIVSATGRAVVISDSLVDGVLDGGYLEVGPDQWFIEHNIGANLTMLTKVPASVAGSACAVYDGCDHSYTTCRDKFDNVKRHGGFPLFPSENPFTQRYAKERRTG